MPYKHSACNNVRKGTNVRTLMRVLSFLAAAAVMCITVFYPRLIAETSTSVPHGFFVLMMIGMSFCWVHGFGFIPQNRALRVCFSPVVAWPLIALGLSAEQMHFRTRCNSPVPHRNEAVSHFRPVNRFQFQPSIFHTASCQCHHSIFADFFWNLCFCISNARGRFRYFIRFFSRLIHRVGTDGKIPRGLLQRYRQHSMQPVKIHDF